MKRHASVSRKILLAVAAVLALDLLLVVAVTVLQTESLSRSLYAQELAENASYPATAAWKAFTVPDTQTELARFVADYESYNPYRIGFVASGTSTDLPWIDGARIAAIRARGGSGVVRVGDRRYEVLVIGVDKATGLTDPSQASGLDLVMGKEIPLLNEQGRRFLLYSAATMLLVALPTLLALYFVLKRTTDPVVAMSRVAERIADGDFSEDVDVRTTDEIGDLGRSINHMTQRLRENEAAREERWATVSHELRTPLATLKANTKGILDGVVRPEESERYLRASLGEIDRLARLVDDLILASSYERGTPLDLAEGDVGTLVEQVAEAMRILAEERGATLVLDVAYPLPARFDALQLRQVFLNLLDNAVRHSPKGGRVFVSAVPRDGRVAVTVRDEGPGLGEGDPERWFEKRRKAPGSPGLGLGLPIARLIVEAHGGTIRGRNAEGGGAEFEVVL
jgi:signal transduction histidine kinase